MRPLPPPPANSAGSPDPAGPAPAVEVLTVRATPPDSPTTTPDPRAETPAKSAPKRGKASESVGDEVEIPKMSGIGWLDKRMKADAARLDKLPAGRYSIQLMTADPSEKGAIESFLRAAARELNPDRIMVYPSGTPDNPRVSVLYGNYVERADAGAELAQLPPRLAQFRPYVRSFQAIRDDLRGSR